MITKKVVISVLSTPFALKSVCLQFSSGDCSHICIGCRWESWQKTVYACLSVSGQWERKYSAGKWIQAMCQILAILFVLPCMGIWYTCIFSQLWAPPWASLCFHLKSTGAVRAGNGWASTSDGASGDGVSSCGAVCGTALQRGTGGGARGYGARPETMRGGGERPRDPQLYQLWFPNWEPRSGRFCFRTTSDLPRPLQGLFTRTAHRNPPETMSTNPRKSSVSSSPFY